MPIKLSYINARGEEAVLDDDEGSFAHELIGREGFEFPSLDLAEHNYGNGTTDIVAITVKNREVTCYFWADCMDIPHWEDKFEEVKYILLQTGQKENEWGKLKIRVSKGRDEQDGKRSHYVYLNCVYSKGLDTLVRDNQNRVKFSLTFKATDPYFYDGFEYSVTTKASDDGYLYMNNAQICDSEEEAKTYSGWTGAPNLSGNTTQEIVSTTGYYWMIPGTNPAKYYAYAVTEDKGMVYMKDASITNSATNAKNLTNDSTGEREGIDWWQTGEDSYYARLEEGTLFMKSAESESINDVYIMAEKVYPNIYIHGPAENISLVNNTTGRKIQLDGSITLNSSQAIRIVTAPFKRSIKRSGVNLIPYLTEDSTLDWYLEHGNNEVQFYNSNTSTNSYVTYTYTERRVSVV